MTTHADTAKKLVWGDRNNDYGSPKADFDRIAKCWSGLMGEKLKADLNAVDVGLMMAALKLCRHAHKRKDDNLTDGHGYLMCIERIEEEHAASPLKKLCQSLPK
jgi:Domain of unknown function (DUF6378)